MNEQELNGNTATDEVVESTTQDTQVEVEEPKTTTQTTEALDKPAEKTFTQAQLDEIVKDRLSQKDKSVYKLFGVSDETSLNDYIKAHSDMADTIISLKKEVAFLKNDIEPARFGDIETFFKGLGKDIDADSLKELCASHPEWIRKKVEEKPTFRPLSQERGHTIVETDDDKMKRIFGI